MTLEQSNYLQSLNNMQEKLTYAGIDYWQKYSMGTWQFWVTVMLLLLPLVFLYFLIDRRKALLLGFYGFSVHILFTYIDAYGTSFSLWSYPYKALPLLPVSFSLDVSFVPVSYMLVYQWSLNREKNYYVYFIALSLFFAFIFKPMFNALGLFQLHKGTNYFHLFVGYLSISLLSKWITNLFLYFLKQGNSSKHEVKVRSKLRIRERAK